MSFGNNLRTLIDEKNMTQKELAQQLNIAASTMSCYVQNVREPDFATLMLLADYFGVSTDFLLDHQANPSITAQEDDLLRVFRTLRPDQREMYLEQGKAIMRINEKETASSAATSAPGGKAV